MILTVFFVIYHVFALRRHYRILTVRRLKLFCWPAPAAVPVSRPPPRQRHRHPGRGHRLHGRGHRRESTSKAPSSKRHYRTLDHLTLSNQETLLRELSGRTVICVAHRLDTIVNYDKILVLDQGRIREFDSPASLLGDRNSAFYSMMQEHNLRL